MTCGACNIAVMEVYNEVKLASVSDKDYKLMPHTFGLILSRTKWTSSPDDFIKDDGKSVNISLLRTTGRDVRITKQLRCLPQQICEQFVNCEGNCSQTESHSNNRVQALLGNQLSTNKSGKCLAQTFQKYNDYERERERERKNALQCLI
jgi:hypothetical protein